MDAVSDGMGRNAAVAMDLADPLASLRDEFCIVDDNTIYLDGHSLGRLPLSVRERLVEVIDGDWGRDLVSAWDRWVEWPLTVGDRLGSVLLGAGPGQVVLTDSTTVNLFKVASAVLGANSGALVTDASNFPTDRYVLAGLAAQHGVEMRLIDVDFDQGPDPEAVARAAQGASLVCLSLVDFRSGALAPIEEITAACRRAGALVCWDLSHAVGAVEIDLEGAGAELAVGCTYKYVNAGPGAPAFTFVGRELQSKLRQPIWGWFGQRKQFVMGPIYDPHEGIAQQLTGTPSVLGLAAVDSALSVIEKAGMAALRSKGRALVGYASELADAWLRELGFALGGPREPALRGSHITLRHPSAYVIGDRLAHDGIMGDVRPPDLLRFGLASAYTRFVDIWDALHRLGELVGPGGDLNLDG